MGRLHDWADRGEAFLNAPNRRVLIFTALAGGVLTLASLLFWDWTQRVFWSPLRTGLLALRDEPMGTAGAVLALTILLCIVLAFVDTSP